MADVPPRSQAATLRPAVNAAGETRVSHPAGRGVAETAGPVPVDLEAVRSTSATSRVFVALESLRFGQNRRVFRDDAVAAEHEVGRRFADAARRVDVGGDAAARLVGN